MTSRSSPCPATLSCTREIRSGFITTRIPGISPGWCRNEWDSTVTMKIQGEEEKIDQVIMAIERGTYVVFNPDEELLEIIRTLASAEGLFVWQP